MGLNLVYTETNLTVKLHCWVCSSDVSKSVSLCFKGRRRTARTFLLLKIFVSVVPTRRFLPTSVSHITSGAFKRHIDLFSKHGPLDGRKYLHLSFLYFQTTIVLSLFQATQMPALYYKVTQYLKTRKEIFPFKSVSPKRDYSDMQNGSNVKAWSVLLEISRKIPTDLNKLFTNALTHSRLE